MLQLNSEAADILNDLQQVLNKELDYLSEIFAKRLESSFYSIKIMSLFTGLFVLLPAKENFE